MKIWNVISGAQSGALNVALLVGDFLAKQGHCIRLVFRKYNKTNQRDAVVVKDRCTLDYIAELSSQIRKENPDLILVHGYSTHIWTKLAAAYSGMKVRLIHVEHNTEHYTPLRSWLTKKLDLCTERYICVSQGVAECLLKQGVDADKVTVIYNGIDTERFHREKQQQPVYTIGMTARFSRQKDQMTLIRAVEALHQIEKNEVRLILLGEGKTKKQCMDYVKSHGLQEYICFQSGSFVDLAPQLDLFVLSTHYEGLPLVLCEAMAARIPVIASDVPGVDEIVLDAETGFLFPESDVNSLAEKILYCKENRHSSNLHAMLDQAERILAERFSVDKMCASYQVFIENEKI